MVIPAFVGPMLITKKRGFTKRTQFLTLNIGLFKKQCVHNALFFDSMPSN